MATELILDFLKFVEAQKNQSVRQMMDRILRKSRLLTKAEAGTVYILRKRGRKRWLEPVSVQNDAVKIQITDYTLPVGRASVAGYVAQSGRTVNVADVYKLPKNSPYKFDVRHERPDYTTRSMLCFPLKNFQDEVTGVVQLINCRPRKRGRPVSFDPASKALVAPIARVLGDLVERAALAERIQQKNRTLGKRNEQLEAQRIKIASLQEQTEQAFRFSIQLFARAAEIYDEDTGYHITRVNEYSFFIARSLGMPDSWCEEIRYTAQLHDVGKMGIDSAILKKKGHLNMRERQEMNMHTVYGYRMLSASPRLKMGAEIALNHHENWDGSGYPYGLKERAIPLSARIVKLADVYDALRSKRSYKPSFSHAKARRIITEGDANIDPERDFDPRLIELFQDQHREFDHIYSEWADAPASRADYSAAGPPSLKVD